MDVLGFNEALPADAFLLPPASITPGLFNYNTACAATSQITASAASSNLSPGTYTGGITLVPQGANAVPTVIPVVLTVSSLQRTNDPSGQLRRRSFQSWDFHTGLDRRGRGRRAESGQFGQHPGQRGDARIRDPGVAPGPGDPDCPGGRYCSEPNGRYNRNPVGRGVPRMSVARTSIGVYS
jgi:hypothetical protein